METFFLLVGTLTTIILSGKQKFYLNSNLRKSIGSRILFLHIHKLSNWLWFVHKCYVVSYLLNFRVISKNIEYADFSIDGGVIISCWSAENFYFIKNWEALQESLPLLTSLKKNFSDWQKVFSNSWKINQYSHTYFSFFSTFPIPFFKHGNRYLCPNLM